jgi:hypothetical protein
MGRSHPRGPIFAPGKGNKPLASMPVLNGLGRAVLGLYYPDKINILRISGLFLDLPKANFRFTRAYFLTDEGLFLGG